jgi:para-nitrobenzyl esterase
VSFARTGNPNNKLLPKWEPFSAAKRATMIFNNDCRAANDPYRDERFAIAAAERQRPITEG